MLKTTQYRLLIALNGSMMLLALLCLIEEYGFKTLPLNNWVLHLLQMTSVIVLLITRYYLWSISKERRWKHLLPDIILLVVQILALLFLPQMLREVAPPSRIFWSLFHVFLLAMVVLRVARYTVTVASGRSPTRVLFGSFTFVIFTGAILLMLPAAHRGETISFTDAVFTATSATCVTGLTVLDPAGGFTHLGQTIILFLIQIGGLGIMIFGTLFAFVLGNPLTLRESVAMKDILNEQAPGRITRLVVFICFSTFLIELLGFCGLLDMWHSPLPLADRIYKSMFHAISAFCNAGFDLFGAAGSLTQFHSDALVLLTISGLIIIGGMGFAVVVDLLANRLGFRKLHLHSKIVVVMTLGLLFFGALGIAALEWRNPGTLAFEGARPGDKLLNAWFQSVTARTAGFNALPQNSLREASKVLTSALMFIGASPASTGGGIKTTTLFVLLVLVRSVFVGRSDVNAFRRRLPLMLIRTALSIFLISLVLLVGGAMLMSALEEGKGISMMDLVYEQVSALATVGLSSAGTGGLSHPTQVWLVLLMYFGRVGPLTMMLSFSRAGEHQSQGVRYAEEQIYVG